MIEQRFMCDLCARPALRPYLSQGKVVCPYCALREASDLIRNGLPVVMEPASSTREAPPVATSSIARIYEHPRRTIAERRASREVATEIAKDF